MNNHLMLETVAPSLIVLLPCLSALTDERCIAFDLFQEQVAPFFLAHCVRCHGQDTSEADLFLDDLSGDVSRSDELIRWEKVLEMLSLNQMPPAEEPQPASEE